MNQHQGRGCLQHRELGKELLVIHFDQLAPQNDMVRLQGHTDCHTDHLNSLHGRASRTDHGKGVLIRRFTFCLPSGLFR